MKQLSWRDIAIERIAHSLIEAEAQAVLLNEDYTPKFARKFCNADERYPFGMRKYTPYQTWLEELRLIPKFFQTKRPTIEYKHWRGLVDSKGLPKGNTSRNREVAIAAGQMSLLDN
jgi:hypothetical protein